MKKIISILVVLMLLCGCENTAPEYLVSSMGFDSVNGEYNVCLEAVIVNTETTEQSVKLLKGEGKTVEEAIAQINKQCTQPLLFAHCGVLAIGDSITEEQLKEIGNFCFNEDEITLSAFFISTENAEKLLSVKPVSSICAGYDIMGLVKENKQHKNRLFEVMSAGYKSEFSRVSLKDGGLRFDG